MFHKHRDCILQMVYPLRSAVICRCWSCRPLLKLSFIQVHSIEFRKQLEIKDGFLNINDSIVYVEGFLNVNMVLDLLYTMWKLVCNQSCTSHELQTRNTTWILLIPNFDFTRSDVASCTGSTYTSGAHGFTSMMVVQF